MAEHEPTLWEITRILTELKDTMKNLVQRVEHQALERRVDELEDGRKSLWRICAAAVAGVIVTAVYAALQLKGATP